MDDRKANSRRKTLDSLIILILIVFVGGFAFEMYGHYAYVNTKGSTVVRVDRITGDTCTMPCNADTEVVAAPDAVPSSPAKTCHAANVVRVDRSMRVPANRPPVTYHLGGFDAASPVVRAWKRHIVPFASELSDGHVYAFSAASFVVVSTWSTGQDVEVCATWSKIERRPFYSVGGVDDAEPAAVAI